LSDRINGFSVVLDKDYKDEDAACIADAIRMIKGISKVTSNVVTTADHIAEQRIRDKFLEKILDVFNS